MTKSVLNLYLQKVKEGDEAYLQKLCARLAERLVHVPITNSSSDPSDGPGMKVNVMRIQEAHRSLIPVLTSERMFKVWSERKGESFESIALLGSDFCAVLGKNSWLAINPGFPESVELQPFVVEMIAQAAQDDAPPVRREVAERVLSMVEEPPEPIELEPSKIIPSAQIPEDSIQVESVSGTKIMVREKSATAILRPVDAPTGSESKKRSFLSFLKLAK